ncbi:hypothetical protein Ait01nite_036620 [Actinoplanes italicus]|uniref:ABC-type nickel/cobalt efflux system permease component RcnA n=1 Tax=Actinoplanes italicus TaxID=113567 RepID=A0A2T0K8G7_9ACTN|nr:hypothetical protein [Actinoplanes italicus]PRX19368.1 ABC-type nickel/cobalt efflux system permease component RcnA [Actinoplanes italicus]GIE30617.1 hypothetical protein Ait01nite_036620 [Actinoplanes italicus]
MTRTRTRRHVVMKAAARGRWAVAVMAVTVAAGLLAWPATPAAAHPRGNFSVNQYAGLALHPDRVDVAAVVDVAEIPTVQDRARADSDGNGTLSQVERDGYAAAECARLAGGFAATVDGHRLGWTISGPVYEVLPGTGGLSTSRLDCRLSAPARLDGPAEVRVDNGYRIDRVGWREITAAGNGVVVDGSTVPEASVSGQLRSYPTDLLSSAPDVRTATIRVGGASGPEALAGTSPAVGPGAFEAGPEWLASAQGRVEAALGGRLTPLVIGLAFLLALVLGAGHAVLPGHGKTVMAAYFAGRQGRVRDAFAVGGAVTVAHTGTVLVLGLLLSTSTAMAGERVLTVLGVVSGVLVVLVGVAMLVSARRARAAGRQGEIGAVSGFAAHTHDHRSTHHDRSHSHAGHVHHEHDQALRHVGGGHGHDRPHHHRPREHEHDHAPGPDGRAGGGGRNRRRRLGLAGIGLAGGLVPSPSALVVLLGAIGLGRAGLGVALVIAYGVGMAATLTAVGLLLVVLRHRLAGLAARAGRAGALGRHLSGLTRRVAAGTPTATAALVMVVGLGIGFRAIA